MKERKEYKRLSSLIEILNTKEKGRGKSITVEQIIRSLNSFGIPLAIWRKK